MITIFITAIIILLIVHVFKHYRGTKQLSLPADQTTYFLNMAIDYARTSMQQGKGGPFGAVIVKDGHVIAIGTNHVTSLNDPTAHAEVMAIRNACRKLGTYQLSDCQIYTSCEPCPMCFGAIYWARLNHIYFAANKFDAARVGFDDSLIYQELETPAEKRIIKATHVTNCQEKAQQLFRDWQKKDDKVHY